MIKFPDQSSHSSSPGESSNEPSSVGGREPAPFNPKKSNSSKPENSYQSSSTRTNPFSNSSSSGMPTASQIARRQDQNAQAKKENQGSKDAKKKKHSDARESQEKEASKSDQIAPAVQGRQQSDVQAEMKKDQMMHAQKTQSANMASHVKEIQQTAQMISSMLSNIQVGQSASKEMLMANFKDMESIPEALKGGTLEVSFEDTGEVKVSFTVEDTQLEKAQELFGNNRADQLAKQLADQKFVSNAANVEISLNGEVVEVEKPQSPQEMMSEMQGHSKDDGESSKEDQKVDAKRDALEE